MKRSVKIDDNMLKRVEEAFSKLSLPLSSSVELCIDAGLKVLNKTLLAPEFVQEKIPGQEQRIDGKEMQAASEARWEAAKNPPRGI